MIGVFGSYELPATAGYSPIAVASDLADFVSSMNVDGIDINWQDTNSFTTGIG
jgi:hypothetical protein